MSEKFFDPVFLNYHFHYENRLLALVEKFKTNLSLFSVFMHFLRCIRFVKGFILRQPTVKYVRGL